VSDVAAFALGSVYLEPSARAACDTLERMTDKAKWPYPSYETLVYSHHHDVAHNTTL
jgi:glutamine synthetase type III